MSHTISNYDGVMTIRLHGRLNANELYQDMRKYLDNGSIGPVIVFVDFSLVTGALGLAVKQVLFRGLQHHNVLKVGFFGAALEVQKELAEVIPVLSRVRPVFADLTETDLRAKMGLIQQQPERKLSGMLKYLNQKPA